MSQTTHDHLLDKIRGALKDLRLPEMLAQLDKELAAVA
jgi:hypothetical protein